jgi:hypothetical protein
MAGPFESILDNLKGRSGFADGGSTTNTRITLKEKQKLLKDIKKFVADKFAKNEKVTLSDLSNKFGKGPGKRREYLYRQALEKDYDKILKLKGQGIGKVGIAVKDKLNKIVEDVAKGKRPILDLTRSNLIKKLPPVSTRQLTKYLSENPDYKNNNLYSKLNKVQQRVTRGNEEFKDATVKNLDQKLRSSTTTLQRPSPKRIEEFIVRDLGRHDTQGGKLFKIVNKKDKNFLDKIKILDVKKNEILTTKKIKDLVNANDPRFKEYKQVFNEIKEVRKTPYVNPVTKEKSNLLSGLQKATGFKQPLNIDHLEGVKKNPLKNLAVSTYKSNLGANIKNITPEQADALGRKKFTVNQNVDRLTKFADRRLLQEAASGFEKVPTPSQTLKSKGLIKTLLKTGLKALPLIGTVLGLGDTVSAYGMGIRNPIDLLTAYNISPEAALESKQYREDPEFRKKSIAELPVIQTEDFTSYFNGGIVSLKGVKK